MQATAIIETLRSSPFSTDMDSVKLYPIVVRIFNQQHGNITCLLLTLEDYKAGTEETFNLVDTELKKG